MLDEVDGPMNFTQMVTLFATKMAGGSDDDDVILASFEAFEQDGKIDAETFRAQLMTFGNKFSASEVDDAFAEFQIDGEFSSIKLNWIVLSNIFLFQVVWLTQLTSRVSWSQNKQLKNVSKFGGVPFGLGGQVNII